MCSDFIAVRLNQCTAGENATVVGNDSEIVGKLIRQVFRTVSVASANLENQQHGSVAASRVIEVHFSCVELADNHIRYPDIRLPDIMGFVARKIVRPALKPVTILLRE